MPRAPLVLIALVLGAAPPAAADAPPCDHGKQCGDLAYEAWERKDTTSFAALTARACDLGYGHGCYVLAQVRADGLGGTPDPAAAGKLLQKACTLGSALGCNDLAIMVHDGMLGAKIDVAAARTHARRGCQLGLAKACVMLDAWNGTPAPTPPPDATARCQRDDSAACVARATELWKGGGPGADAAGAARLFERGCKLGNQLGCAGAAALQEAKDPKKAAPRFQRACDAGSTFACGRLARLYRDGRGVKPDPVKAVRYAELGCPADPNDRDGEACAWLAEKGRLALGLALFSEAAPLVDFERPFRFASRGCDAGQASACALAAAILERTGSHAEGLRARAAACGYGDADSCQRGAKRDPGRATLWAECSKGTLASCEVLARPPATPPAKAPATPPATP